MGVVYARIEVANIMGGEETFSMPVLVDTGSTDTVIPENELDRLGIKREKKQNYELADGSIVTYDVGFAFLHINGEKVVTNVVFGEEGVDPLLGVIALESAGFIVDPVNQILRKLESVPLK